jgi:hypothetical protein
MSVHGNGEMRRFTTPQLPVPEGLEAFDPKISHEEEYENGVELVFDKTIEYVILPKTPGNYAIMPQMSFFDPDSNRYRTLKAPDSIRIVVVPGPNYQPLANDVDSLDTTILVDTKQPNFFANIWSKFGPSLLFLLLVLTTLGVFFFLHRKKQKDLSLQTSIGNKIDNKRDATASSQIKLIHQERHQNTDPQASESTTISPEKPLANEQERLSAAKTHMLQGNVRAFYDEVYHLLIALAAQRYGLSPAQISPSAVQMKIQDARNEAFIAVWQTCEEALFAHQDKRAEMEDTLRQVAFLLK